MRLSRCLTGAVRMTGPFSWFSVGIFNPPLFPNLTHSQKLQTNKTFLAFVEYKVLHRHNFWRTGSCCFFIITNDNDIKTCPSHRQNNLYQEMLFCACGLVYTRHVHLGGAVLVLSARLIPGASGAGGGIVFIREGSIRALDTPHLGGMVEGARLTHWNITQVFIQTICKKIFSTEKMKTENAVALLPTTYSNCLHPHSLFQLLSCVLDIPHIVQFSLQQYPTP